MVEPEQFARHPSEHALLARLARVFPEVPLENLERAVAGDWPSQTADVGVGNEAGA
jgi:hypothetical protein